MKSTLICLLLGFTLTCAFSTVIGRIISAAEDECYNDVRGVFICPKHGEDSSWKCCGSYGEQFCCEMSSLIEETSHSIITKESYADLLRVKRAPKKDKNKLVTKTVKKVAKAAVVGRRGMSGAIITLIVVGALAGVAIIVFLVIWYLRHSNIRSMIPARENVELPQSVSKGYEPVTQTCFPQPPCQEANFSYPTAPGTSSAAYDDSLQPLVNSVPPDSLGDHNTQASLGLERPPPADGEKPVPYGFRFDN